MSGKILYCFILVLYCCVLSNAGQFLKEKPDFLRTCERKNADFRVCFAKGLQHIFTEWKDGIPGVEDIVPLDPMFVDKFNVIEDSENKLPISVKMTNITVKGLNKAKVNNVSINDKDYNFKLTYSVPLTRLDGDYSALGQILLLRIDSKGKMFMEIGNGVYTIAVKNKLLTRDGNKFFDLHALKFNLKSIQNVRLNFSNLFRDKALNENTNAVFNENWRTFYDLVQPEIEKEISKVLFIHFQRIFNNVPANYFIADVLDAED